MAAKWMPPRGLCLFWGEKCWGRGSPRSHELGDWHAEQSRCPCLQVLQLFSLKTGPLPH